MKEQNEGPFAEGPPSKRSPDRLGVYNAGADSVDPELLADLRELRSAAVRLLVVCERMQDELGGAAA